MTLFDQTITPPTETIPEGSNALDTLVGDGKKFKDTEALAKGKLEADRHATQLERENASARERIKEIETELQTRITLQAFMDELKTNRESGLPVTTPETNTQVSTPSTQVDIDKLLDQKLEDNRRRDVAQANVNMVQAELVKAWGTSYLDKLLQRQQDLGLSKDFLGSVAETSPKAFLELVLPRQSTRHDPNVMTPPRTELNSSSMDTGTIGLTRNKAYYDKLKKQDLNMYKSERMTAQRHKDAQRLGEAFFSE